MKIFKLVLLISTVLSSKVYAVKFVVNLHEWRTFAAEDHPNIRELNFKTFFSQFHEKISKYSHEPLSNYYKNLYLKFSKALEIKKGSSDLEKVKTLNFAANTLLSYRVMIEGDNTVYLEHIKSYLQIYNELLESEKLTHIPINQEDLAFARYFFENRWSLKAGLHSLQIKLIDMLSEKFDKVAATWKLTPNDEIRKTLTSPLEHDIFNIMVLMSEAIELNKKHFHIFRNFGLISDVYISVDDLGTVGAKLQTEYIKFLQKIPHTDIVKFPIITSNYQQITVDLTITKIDFQKYLRKSSITPMEGLLEFTLVVINGKYHDSHLEDSTKLAVKELEADKRTMEKILNTLNSDLVVYSKLEKSVQGSPVELLIRSSNLYHKAFKSKLSDLEYSLLFKIIAYWETAFAEEDHPNAFGAVCIKKVRSIFETKKNLENPTPKVVPNKQNNAKNKKQKKEEKLTQIAELEPNASVPESSEVISDTPEPINDDKGKEEEKKEAAFIGKSEDTTVTVTDITFAPKSKKKQKSKAERERLKKQRIHETIESKAGEIADQAESSASQLAIPEPEIQKKKQKSKSARKREQQQRILDSIETKAKEVVAEQEAVRPEKLEASDKVFEEIELVNQQETELLPEVLDEIETVENLNSIERVDSEEILAEDIESLPEEIADEPISEEKALDKITQMQIAHKRLYSEAHPKIRDLLEYTFKIQDRLEYKFRIAGGWIRDRLKNKPSKDYDMLFVGSEIELRNIIKREGGTCVKVKNPFNLPIYSATFPGMAPIDIARRDSKTFNLRLNAFSRDATINTLFMTKDGIEDATGRAWDELMDDNALLTAPRPNNDHNRSFSEDPKRMIRFIILKNKYNRNLSDDLTVGIFNNRKLIAKVPTPIFLEFVRKLLNVSDNKEYALKDAFVLLHEVFPDFRIDHFKDLIGEKDNLSIHDLLYVFLHEEIQKTMIPEFNIDESILHTLDRVGISSNHKRFEEFRSVLYKFFEVDYIDVLKNKEDYDHFLKSNRALVSDFSDLTAHEVDILTRAADETDSVLLQSWFRPGSILFFIYMSNINRFINH